MTLTNKLSCTINSKSSGLVVLFRILISSNYKKVYIKVFDTNIEETAHILESIYPRYFIMTRLVNRSLHLVRVNSQPNRVIENFQSDAVIYQSNSVTNLNPLQTVSKFKLQIYTFKLKYF